MFRSSLNSIETAFPFCVKSALNKMSVVSFHRHQIKPIRLDRFDRGLSIEDRTNVILLSLPRCSCVRLAFGKVWYDVYSPKREHVVSLMLRKSHLRSRIQHRVLDIDIFDCNESEPIGRIYPYSTHLERSEYGPATAVKGKSARISNRRHEDDPFSSIGDESGNQSHALDCCTRAGQSYLLRSRSKCLSSSSVF